MRRRLIQAMTHVSLERRLSRKPHFVALGVVTQTELPRERSLFQMSKRVGEADPSKIICAMSFYHEL
jgi:hypothetical protein